MTRFQDNLVVVFIRIVCFQIPLTMVNSIGLLEDGDLEPSSPGNPKLDRSYGKYSEAETDPEGDGEDSDNAYDMEEVGPTYKERSYNPLNISITGLNQSGANLFGSGDPASRK